MLADKSHRTSGRQVSADYICSVLLAQERIDFLKNGFGIFIMLLLSRAYSNSRPSNKSAIALKVIK